MSAPARFVRRASDAAVRIESSHDQVLRLIALTGSGVQALHLPEGADAAPSLSGRDADIAVEALDPMWPLRLAGGWRLCQCLHYDLGGWYWVLERAGSIICLDTIMDPLGLGRDGHPTRGMPHGEGLWAPPAVQAAYLVAKRLRKDMRSAAEWRRIAALARQDRVAFADALRAVVGPVIAAALEPAVFDGSLPPPAQWRRLRLRQRLRRFRTPRRAALAMAKGTRRRVARLLHPTGMIVHVVGPDGAGKSTLARSLPSRCSGVFKRFAVAHWRPGVLPRPGVLLGRRPSDPAAPHARAPHRRLLSMLRLGYYWTDTLLGTLAAHRALTVRTGLVVIERGWWDIAVDPRRYGLRVRPATVRWLGRLLPKPDLVLHLDAAPPVLLRRKREISAAEIGRQAAAWRTVLPHGVAVRTLPATEPPDQVAARAREEIIGALERRAVAHLGSGWAALPSRARPRWVVPRAPARLATQGLLAHRPVSPRGILAWYALRAFARLGGTRLLPRTELPAPVRLPLAAHLPLRGTIAVAPGARPGRWTALVLDARGRPHAVAKVATTPDGRAALAEEAARLRGLDPLPPPLLAPRVRAEQPGLLVMEAERWTRPGRPWRLTPPVAQALGTLASQERAHPDPAPWNMLVTGRGTALLDWEDRPDATEPLAGLCHFLIRSHVLLGRPTARALRRGLMARRGALGRAIGAYARAAGVSPDAAPAAFRAHLGSCLAADALGSRQARRAAALMRRFGAGAA